jgi:hypothetical protein
LNILEQKIRTALTGQAARFSLPAALKIQISGRDKTSAVGQPAGAECNTMHNALVFLIIQRYFR